MKHKGSISCKHPSFATLNLFLLYFPHPECLAICQEGKAQRTGGEVEEEEPEGEIVRGPSGEATIHDSGIMHSLFLLLLIHAYTYIYICIYIDIYIYTHVFYSSHIPLQSFSLLFLEQMYPLMRRQGGPRPRKRVMWRHYVAGWKWGVSS